MLEKLVVSFSNTSSVRKGNNFFDYKILQKYQKLHLDFLLIINYDVVDIKGAFKSVPAHSRKNRSGCKNVLKKKQFPKGNELD